jgi:heat shock protein HslJ
MRRFAVQLVALAVLAAACGSANETTVAPSTSAAPEALQTGREAILANNIEGQPYVLWYWGAH